MTWFIWALMLLAQNASFTWVSRARNSSSVGYHAIAAVFSNGIFFINLFIGVDMIGAATEGTPWLMAATVMWYTLWTVVGSVAMHHFLQTKVEKGKRKVGAR